MRPPAALVDALYDDEVQAIILNEGYIPVLTEQDGYKDFPAAPGSCMNTLPSMEMRPSSPPAPSPRSPL